MTTFKMPEPDVFTESIDYDAFGRGCGINKHYSHSPNQLKQALRDVLEQAAQLFPQPHMEYFGRDIQDAIRAIKEQIK